MSHLAPVRDPGPGDQRHDAGVQEGGHVEHDADDEDEERGPGHGCHDEGRRGQVSQGLLAGGDSAAVLVHDHVRRKLQEGLGSVVTPS